MDGSVSFRPTTQDLQVPVTEGSLDRSDQLRNGDGFERAAPDSQYWDGAFMSLNFIVQVAIPETLVEILCHIFYN